MTGSRCKLLAVDRCGGQAIFHQGGVWYRIAVDDDWKPRELGGSLSALRCAMLSPYRQWPVEYPDLATMVTALEEELAADLQVESVPLSDVLHMFPEELRRSRQGAREDAAGRRPRGRRERGIAEEPGPGRRKFAVAGLMAADREAVASAWKALPSNDPAVVEQLGDAVREVCRPVFLRAPVAREAVDELLAETVLSVWRFAKERGEPPASFRGFLKWRARSVLSSYVRDRRRLGHIEDLERVPEPASASQGPWAEATLGELRAALAACRKALNPSWRRSWRLRYDENLSVREIAARTGDHSSTVAVKLYRAKEAMWACLRRKKVL